MAHSQNVGNNLLKYAISITLSKLGFVPYIIGIKIKNQNISLLQQYTKVKIINNSFQEINKTEYNILMVNSDQTWRKWDRHFYDIAFLYFAKNWNIPKFIYGASIGLDNWTLTEKDEMVAKNLLKNFTGISTREKGSINMIEKHLGIKSTFVLDPTFLIDKRYYLKLIKNYKNDFIIQKNFIFIYSITKSKLFKKFINELKEKSNYRIYQINEKIENQIRKFIYGINYCKAVITDSFHGTVFSLIFNKPFISFIFDFNGRERFNTLKEIFNIDNRLFDSNSKPNITLLNIPLKINKTLLKILKNQSINFLKRNLKKL